MKKILLIALLSIQAVFAMAQKDRYLKLSDLVSLRTQFIQASPTNAQNAFISLINSGISLSGSSGNYITNIQPGLIYTSSVGGTQYVQYSSSGIIHNNYTISFPNRAGTFALLDDITGGSYTFNNGLTDSAGNVKLGGNYTGTLTVGDNSSLRGTLTMNGGEAYLSAQYLRLFSKFFDGSEASYLAFGSDPSQPSVFKDWQNIGLHYSGDYSIGRTFPADNNWLPNAKWVISNFAQVDNTGKIPASKLPESELDTAQFELKPNGKIAIKTSYLQSLGLGGNYNPAAPTAGVVDDNAKTFNFTYTPGFTALSDYEQTFNAGSTFSNVTAKPIVIAGAKAAGQVGVRVKAYTGRNASAWLYNASAFTSSNGLTINPLIFASRDALITYNGGANSYRPVWTEGGDTWGVGAYNSGHTLGANSDGSIYVAADGTSQEFVLGFNIADAETYFGNMKVGIRFGSIAYPGILPIDNGVLGSEIESFINGFDYRLNRTSNVWTIQKSNDNWATITTIYTFSYTSSGIPLYPVLDTKLASNNTNIIVNPRYSGF